MTTDFRKFFDQNSFQDDHGILLKLFKNFNQNSGGQPVSNHPNDFWVLEELDDHGILVKFFKDLITSRIRWLRNSYEILQGFRAEFWLPALVSNNSDDYRILQKLDDLRILIKLSLDFDQNSADSFWKWLIFGSEN